MFSARRNKGKKVTLPNEIMNKIFGYLIPDERDVAAFQMVSKYTNYIVKSNEKEILDVNAARLKKGCTLCHKFLDDFYENVEIAYRNDPKRTRIIMENFVNSTSPEFNADTILNHIQQTVHAEYQRIISQRIRVDQMIEQFSFFLKKIDIQYVITRKYADKISNVTVPEERLTKAQIRDKILIRKKSYNPPRDAGSMSCAMYDPVTKEVFFGNSGAKRETRINELNALPPQYGTVLLTYLNSIDENEYRFGVSCAEIECFIRLIRKRQARNLPTTNVKGVHSMAWLTGPGTYRDPCRNCASWTKKFGIVCFLRN